MPLQPLVCSGAVEGCLDIVVSAARASGWLEVELVLMALGHAAQVRTSTQLFLYFAGAILFVLHVLRAYGFPPLWIPPYRCCIII